MYFFILLLFYCFAALSPISFFTTSQMVCRVERQVTPSNFPEKCTACIFLLYFIESFNILFRGVSYVTITPISSTNKATVLFPVMAFINYDLRLCNSLYLSQIITTSITSAHNHQIAYFQILKLVHFLPPFGNKLLSWIFPTTAI